MLKRLLSTFFVIVLSLSGLASVKLNTASFEPSFKIPERVESANFAAPDLFLLVVEKPPYRPFYILGVKKSYSGFFHNGRSLWVPDINGSYQGMGRVGGLLAVIDKTNNKTYIPSIDKPGSVHSYIDAETGQVAQEISYDPYGRIISNEGSVDIPLKFHTKYYDSELGLYYYGYRFYDPSTCKWLSRDPLGEAGGYNLYAFCGNDPVNGVDYLGAMDWEEFELKTKLLILRSAMFIDFSLNISNIGSGKKTKLSSYVNVECNS